MYFYIDGDNAPGARTEGIKELETYNKVKIFYAQNNKYYSQKKHRDELRRTSKCSVDFVEVEPGVDSVDFFIAMHIVKDASNIKRDDVICLVSADKHFDIIERCFNQMQLNIRAKRVETIEEGLNRFCLLDVSSIEDLEKRLIKIYGPDCCKKILANIFKMTIKRGLLDKLLIKKAV